MTAMFLMNRKSYMPGVALNMRDRTNAQVDVAKFLSGLGVDHAEEEGCNSMDGMLTESQELQVKIAVPTIFEVNTVV